MSRANVYALDCMIIHSEAVRPPDQDWRSRG